MPKHRKSTMQLLRLPCKAREVLALWDHRKFSSFHSTVIGCVWESGSVQDCFGWCEVSPPSLGRLPGAPTVFHFRVLAFIRAVETPACSPALHHHLPINSYWIQREQT